MAVRLLLGGALDTVASTSTSLSPSPDPTVARASVRVIGDSLSSSLFWLADMHPKFQ
ncbi:hypothetical protein EMIHUDRAFT_198426 [Emiliania huxleyi CCMP1516]|uniref:Uncharacterized protein n=2 Tax=Emiliania huxleyi TaxID=2903 RepID=A0A0D3I792_EMIH1|nr:hypothetical protein EMIHUDRAFT_198426 [Emiliania huxleyi CCMP1516]EOD07127.1 hypothetical protein EMIHUDRAFT_198426 [Emiliania huxleyi CCMP1516]|eukprot:XP_005759556.1 hypothetical protein EMIHUDRAFT_198426 [Emiliania huxleyi CCMP1516]